MECVFSGMVLDPKKCNELSLEEKRKFVREVAESSTDATEQLRCFTRRELLEIICCEMSKERKYTGYSKLQMIEHLLKLISRPNKRSNTDSKAQVEHKRHRIIDEVLTQNTNGTNLVTNKEETAKFRVCENVACRASLSLEDPFCKRCSCCVCQRYDDNKDPSLWLTCGSDTDVKNDDSCGMSCHLECAMKHESSGILKKDGRTKLDGRFHCISCGKVNDIMRSWRKQLMVVKAARRVDVLCVRLSLCHKILVGTEKYKEVQNMVESAVKMLTNEVGQLDHICLQMSRGIVNRLFCGAEVQKICSSAVEYFDSVFLYADLKVSIGIKEPTMTACEIKFEELSSTSVTVVLGYEDHSELGCRLWHRKNSTKDYPEKPTFIVFKPKKRFKITHLEPLTTYFCKVSLIGGRGVLGVWEAKWVTLGAPREPVKEENAVTGQNHSRAESTNSSDIIRLASKDDTVNPRVVKAKGPHLSPSIMKIAPTVSPLTPCKLDLVMRKAPSLVCAKLLEESDYEYSVRVIKWLEDEGHVNGDFRVKFLTWFSLKATRKERRVVSVFVDIFVDDPASLAGQLRHTFLDKICCDEKPVSHHGFCKVCGVESEQSFRF